MAKKDIIKTALLQAEEIEKATLGQAKDLVFESFKPSLQKLMRDVLNEEENLDHDMGINNNRRHDDGTDDDEHLNEEELEHGDIKSTTKIEDEADGKLGNQAGVKGTGFKAGNITPDVTEDGEDSTEGAHIGDKGVNEGDDMDLDLDDVDNDDDDDLDLGADDDDNDSDDSDLGGADDGDNDEDDNLDLDLGDDSDEEDNDSDGSPKMNSSSEFNPDDEDDVFEDDGNNGDENKDDEVLDIPDELFDDEDDETDNVDDELSDDSDNDDNSDDSDEETKDENIDLEEGLFLKKGGKLTKVTPQSYLEGRISELEEERTKLSKAVNYLSGQLKETNLFNAKLAHLNKLYESGLFNKSEKMKIAEKIDRAKTVDQTKKIYSSIVKEAVNKNPLDLIHEVIRDKRFTDSPAPKENVFESADVKRMRVLAGICK